MFWKQGSVDVCSSMFFNTISESIDPMRLTTHNLFNSCFKLSGKNVLDTILGLRLQAIEPRNLGTISGNKFFKVQSWPESSGHYLLQMFNSDSFVHRIWVQHCVAGTKILWKFNGRSIAKVLLKLYKSFKEKIWQCSRFVMHAKGLW
jgi:hypothetical protein